MCAVSIRARHCWRANLVGLIRSPTHGVFQSAPAIAGGRIVVAINTAEAWLVSIRARHCWRANPHSRCMGPRLSPKFQSAPAIAGGRIVSPITRPGALGLFQSAPAIAGGRIAAAAAVLAGSPVSIRARHCWRANRLGMKLCRFVELFQSAPAIAGGRIVVAINTAEAWLVSIRARHCWRANPHQGTGAGLTHKVSIRARHCWRANPH